jgi:hypothetical protein
VAEAGVGGIGIGLAGCDSMLLVAQPASNEQQSPNAGQKVVELLKIRIVEKSTGLGAV